MLSRVRVCKAVASLGHFFTLCYRRSGSRDLADVEILGSLTHGALRAMLSDLSYNVVIVRRTE